MRYCREEGLWKGFRRAGKLAWRFFSKNKTILFYVDLIAFDQRDPGLVDHITLEVKRNEKEISDQDLTRFIRHRGKYRGEDVAASEMRDRFAKGALFYLVRLNKEFVYYFWYIKGRYVSPYYFPITHNDVVLLDAETFPEFRGRGINPTITNHMIHKLKEEGVTRVFLSISASNESSIRAIAKTQFKKYGVARKFRLFGKSITLWYEMGLN